jgi:predicted RNase H-like HicB family nuclease
MTCDVILTRKDNKFVARVREWPEVIAEEKTRDAVIQKIKKKLLEYLTRQVEVIKIEVPLPEETGNPWLDKFGWFKDDPTFDDLQAEMAAYRKEVDQAMEQSAG